MARRIRGISIREQITEAAVMRRILAKHLGLDAEVDARSNRPVSVEIPEGVVAG
jgi:hypothetical protein